MIQDHILKGYNDSRIFDPITEAPFLAKVCHAPFSNMYFGHYGKVTACCENKTFELGRIPTQSISEIWKGDKANELRQYIDEKQLFHGCRVCGEALVSQNYAGVKAKVFDLVKRDQTNSAFPTMMEFELSNTCNLECKMCTGLYSSSIRQNREKLPPIPSVYNETFVDQLAEFIPHLSKANFFGGEPFLIDIYYDIWQKMADLNPNIDVWVISNGTILNNKVKQLLERIRFNLILSIDTFQKDRYELIRKNAKHDRVMAHFEYFYEYSQRKGTGFSVNTCPMVENWMDLPEVVQKCNELDVAVAIIPVRTPASSSLASLSIEKMKEVIQFLKDQEIGGESFMQQQNTALYHGYINLLEDWCFEKMEKERDARFYGNIDADSLDDRLKKFVHNGLRTFVLTEEEEKEQYELIKHKFDGICEGLRNEKKKDVQELLKLYWEYVFSTPAKVFVDDMLSLSQEELNDKVVSILTPKLDSLIRIKGENKMDFFFRKCAVYLHLKRLSNKDSAHTEEELNIVKDKFAFIHQSVSDFSAELEALHLDLIYSSPIGGFTDYSLRFEKDELMSFANEPLLQQIDRLEKGESEEWKPFVLRKISLYVLVEAFFGKILPEDKIDIPRQLEDLLNNSLDPENLLTSWDRKNTEELVGLVTLN